MNASPFLSTLLAAALTLAATGAAAQLRTIPADAKRAEMRHLQAMTVELDGMPAQLSPGAQIRDTSNRIVLPSTVAERTTVRYLLDGSGQVRNVWILSATEAAQPDPQTGTPGPVPRGELPILIIPGAGAPGPAPAPTPGAEPDRGGKPAPRPDRR